MKNRIRKQIFRHYTGFEIATYFDNETGSEIFGPRQFLEYQTESVGSPQNTLDALSGDLFNLIRYLDACSYLQVKHGSWMSDTGTYLNRVLLMYPSFLAEGDLCPNKFIAAVAKELGFKALAQASVGRYLSTANQFLQFNDQEWISHKAICEHYSFDTLNSEQALMGQIAHRTDLKPVEKQAVLTKSMLAGVISGGPKKLRRPKLKMPKRFKYTNHSLSKLYQKAFPINRVLDLIHNASSYRDICLFSLLAGTGIRISEALQLRIEDVLVEEETIQILPYSERIHCYTDLDSDEITQLSFKGRTNEDVHFLRVFQEIFFSNLFDYLDKEREKARPNNEFLFVTLSNNSKGNLWFLGDATSKNRTFKSTQGRMGGLDKVRSIHSLRHFYGTWMRNYEPNEDGFGYPLSYVQRAMGHKSAESTEGYTLPDKALFLKHLENVERTLKEMGFDQTQALNLFEAPK